MATPVFVTTAFGGWTECVEMRVGGLRLVVTTQVGPRLIHLDLNDGPNLFKTYADQSGLTGGDEWRIYGGHRLWHGPENESRTYVPDNAPVRWRVQDHTLHLASDVERTTGIRKTLQVSSGDHENELCVRHVLRNEGAWAVELAVWALSVMAPGGMAILPQEPFRPHPEALEPARPLVLWPYTDMSDPRWTWGSRHVVLRQDPDLRAPQKIGALNQSGWVAYLTDKYLFLKCFDPEPDRPHIDFGCNTELFTNDEMLEVETLSPLHRVAPGETAEHVERWYVWERPFDPKAIAWSTGRDFSSLMDALHSGPREAA